MKIGVVSDTHSNIDNTTRAISVLGQYDLEAILHCGDIGSPSIVPMFAGTPTHFVFGNCDYETALLKKVIQDEGQFCHERFGEIELAERKIALIHSDDASRFAKTIQSGDYDLVCYGHTHRYEKHVEGSTLVLNPGALHRANPHTVAIVDLDDMSVEHLTL